MRKRQEAIYSNLCVRVLLAVARFHLKSSLAGGPPGSPGFGWVFGSQDGAKSISHGLARFFGCFVRTNIDS